MNNLRPNLRHVKSYLQKNIFIYLATELETLERAEKTPMEARIEFEQRIKALELVLLDEEIKNLMTEFSKNPTNELWVQILSLKQEKENVLRVIRDTL